jgi:uncharacterized protein YceK
MKTICLIIAMALLSGCAATKVVTVPLKASAAVIGGTADVLD